MKKVACKNFSCVNDLTKYKSSMLFEHEHIASGTFVCDDRELEISLDVQGKVSVTYKDEVYHSPDEFPDELIDLIKEHPNDRDVYAPSGEWNDSYESCNIYVGLNNWFEYTFDGDGEVYEEDLSKASPDEIREDMLLIAAQYFEEV